MKKSYKISKGNKKRESHFIIELELIFVLFWKVTHQKSQQIYLLLGTKKFKEKNISIYLLALTHQKSIFDVFYPCMHALRAL